MEGKWKATGGENREAILRHLMVASDTDLPAGVTLDDVIAKMVAMEIEFEVKKEGAKYHQTVRVGTAEFKHSFQVGKSGKYPTWDNKVQVDVTPTELTGGRNGIRVEYEYKGVKYVGEREVVSPTQLAETVFIDGGKLSGKYIYTKC